MAIKKVRMKPPGYTDIVHPETSADVVIEDASHRFVTDSEKGIWNAKQAAITGGATTITSSNMTASRALVSDASGKVAVSGVTSTELGYLGGLSGSIQTQINGKANIYSAQIFKLTDDVGLPKSILANTNGAIASGVYRVEPSTLNRPNNVSYGVLIVTSRTGGDIFQEVYSIQGYKFSRVSLNGGTNWSDWKPLAYLENGITESGSNANGSYLKFGDGTLICYRNLGGTTSGSGDIDASIDFPVLFAVTEPTVTAQLKCITHQNWQGQLFQGTTGFNSVRFVVTGAAANHNYAINYTAIGRWK